ncbi:MAG: phosphatase PAP2 family protein [Moraxella sp.]
MLSQLEVFAQFSNHQPLRGWLVWAISTVVMLVALLSQGLVASIVAIKVCAVLLSSFCGYLLYKYLKVHTVRPRPYQVHQTITLGEPSLDVFSFPSGHTLQAVLFTTMIGHQVPMMLWVLLPFTMLVALSRLVLGVYIIPPMCWWVQALVQHLRPSVAK